MLRACNVIPPLDQELSNPRVVLSIESLTDALGRTKWYCNKHSSTGHCYRGTLDQDRWRAARLSFRSTEFWQECRRNSFGDGHRARSFVSMLVRDVLSMAGSSVASTVEQQLRARIRHLEGQLAQRDAEIRSVRLV